MIGDLHHHINGLSQDCSISNALAMEILQSCTKLSISLWNLTGAMTAVLQRCLSNFRVMAWYRMCATLYLNQLERLHSEDNPRASWLPLLLSHIGSQVKRWWSQSYKFKEFCKITNILILKQTLHATHLLKLLDKMCKYAMDPTSIVEDTEWTRFCPRTDRQTDGQRWNQYTPLSTSLKGGYNDDLSSTMPYGITQPHWDEKFVRHFHHCLIVTYV